MHEESGFVKYVEYFSLFELDNVTELTPKIELVL
jgi:hypothetical protein